ncbi:SAM-dependent chlorinase/fluorinase [Candidatus Gottesmanbacteria bacterium]|nr:SAM-dependent chlorinase/fluorinase [Candidatus Gottesmanbacteria bacterium]
MTKGVFIQLIADYGIGDPSFGEVIQKLMLLDPTVRVNPTSVPKFSTIATGFWTAQFALVNPPKELIIYTNTAPRKDNKDSRKGNEGEKLVYALLKNSVKVIGVNAGYCFSFIKPHLKELHFVNVANKGSQFRSRDFYPEAVMGIAKGEAGFIGTALAPSLIPDVPGERIAFIDGYGNLKTTTRRSHIHFTAGDPIRIELNGIRRTAYFTDGTFQVREGEIAFAPGSSGGDHQFMEIFMRGLSAWKEFGKPAVEQEFTVQSL